MGIPVLRERLFQVGSGMSLDGQSPGHLTPQSCLLAREPGGRRFRGRVPAQLHRAAATPLRTPPLPQRRHPDTCLSARGHVTHFCRRGQRWRYYAEPT